MKYIQLAALVIGAAVIIWAIGATIQSGIRSNNAYNARVCATYGLQPDCKTPLIN